MPTILVLPVDSTPGDSVRAIVQRDLSNGDRVTPAFIDPVTALTAAPIGRDSVDFRLLTSAKAAYVIRITRSPKGFHSALRDGVTGAEKQVGDFPFPIVPEDRSQLIRDSLAQDLRVKAAEKVSKLAGDSAVRATC